MSKWYRVEVEEFHKVMIETQANNADEALDKIEDGDWDENTFIVDDETLDRTAVSAEEVTDEKETEGE